MNACAEDLDYKNPRGIDKPVILSLLSIGAGRTHSLGRMGFSALQMPIELYRSLLGGKTTDRRAGCVEIRQSGSEGGAR